MKTFIIVGVSTVLCFVVAVSLCSAVEKPWSICNEQVTIEAQYQFQPCSWTGGVNKSISAANGDGIVVWFSQDRTSIDNVQVMYATDGKIGEISKTIQKDGTILIAGREMRPQPSSVAEGTWSRCTEGFTLWNPTPLPNGSCSWTGSVDENKRAHGLGMVVWVKDGTLDQVLFVNATHGKIGEIRKTIEKNGKILTPEIYVNTGTKIPIYTWSTGYIANVNGRIYFWDNPVWQRTTLTIDDLPPLVAKYSIRLVGYLSCLRCPNDSPVVNLQK